MYPQRDSDQFSEVVRQATVALARQYAAAKGHPLQGVSKTILRHQEELFTFVRDLGVAADNNRAERAMRRIAVERKISGGSRSPTGSKVRMELQTLFSSWAARGENALAACLRLLQNWAKTAALPT